MRQVSVRGARALLPRLEQELAEGGEIVLTRRGRPIARLTRLSMAEPPVSTRDLRARMRPAAVPSEVLVRQDHDSGAG